MSGYHKSTLGSMSTHAYEFHLRRQAEEKRAAREARKLARLEAEAAEGEPPDDFDSWAREIREQATGTRAKAQAQLREIKKRIGGVDVGKLRDDLGKARGDRAQADVICGALFGD